VVARPKLEVPTLYVSIVHLLLIQLTQNTGKTDVTAVQYRFESPDKFKTFHVRRKESSVAESSTHSYSFPRRRSHRHRVQEPPFPDPDPALLRRKHIYRHKLYSLHIGSNRVSQHKPFTPHIFSQSPELQSRARKWIRRELGVFEFLHSNHPRSPGDIRATNIEYLLEFIIAILKAVDIKDSSGQAEELVKEFLGRDNARLFLHELEAWLRSPYVDLKDWDREVQYREEQLRVEGDERIEHSLRKLPHSGPAHYTAGQQKKVEARRRERHGYGTSVNLPDHRPNHPRDHEYEAEEFRQTVELFGESFLLNASQNTH
jgi:hypothetical protein